jgi:hypothetical protein
MRSSLLVLPDLFGRLARVIAAVEEGRAAAPAPGEPVGPANPGDPQHDMESLSLSRHGQSLEPRHDDLDSLALMRLERDAPGRSDSLVDSSLSRPAPARPVI